MRVWRLLALLTLSCGSSVVERTPTAPPPPTDQKATAKEGSVELSWVNPTEADFERVVVARLTPGASGDRPSGQPLVGETVGGGVVLYTGQATSLVDNQVPAGCGPFVYQLWSRNRSGLYSAGPAIVELARGATTPPPAVGPAMVSVGTRGPLIEVRWPERGAAAVTRKSGSTPLTPGDGVVVFSGTGGLATEALEALAPGTSWTYAVFACNVCGACGGTPTTATFTRPSVAPDDGGRLDGGAGPVDAGMNDGGTTAPLLSVSLSSDGQRVQLRWAAASGAGGVRVLRTLNAVPAGASDPQAEVVFDGVASGASEPADRLLPNLAGAPRVYTYSAFACLGTQCGPQASRADLSLTLTQALRGGGYTINWRHASASQCSDRTELGCAVSRPGCTAASSAAANWWRSCDMTCGTATARQLTQPTAGQETTAIQRGFTERGFSVGRVISSEFCRNVQTAQGLNFGPTIEEKPEVTYFVYDEDNRCSLTYGLLNAIPAPGTNTAIINHAGFTCPVLDSLAWAEGAIFKPRAPTGRTCTGPAGCMTDEGCVAGQCVKPLFIARLTHTQWAGLPP